MFCKICLQTSPSVPPIKVCLIFTLRKKKETEERRKIIARPWFYSTVESRVVTADKLFRPTSDGEHVMADYSCNSRMHRKRKDCQIVSRDKSTGRDELFHLHEANVAGEFSHCQTYVFPTINY